MSQIDYGVAYINSGWRPVVVKVGHKWTQVVYIDGGSVKVTKVKDTVRLVPMVLTLRSVARKLMSKKNCLGLKMSHSKAALAILKEAAEVSS